MFLGISTEVLKEFFPQKSITSLDHTVRWVCAATRDRTAVARATRSCPSTRRWVVTALRKFCPKLMKTCIFIVILKLGHRFPSIRAYYIFFSSSSYFFFLFSDFLIKIDVFGKTQFKKNIRQNAFYVEISQKNLNIWMWSDKLSYETLFVEIGWEFSEIHV